MRYSLFLGCVAPHRYPGIEAATRKIFDRLGIDLIDMGDASCCPAPGVFRSIDNLTWLALGARNITIAEENKADILTVCNGCFGSLNEVNYRLKNDVITRLEVNDILSKINREYKGEREVKHVVDVLYNDVGVKVIKESVAVPLEALKVAVHYGCHFLRPKTHLEHNGSARMKAFNALVEATGATNVVYRDKLLCCGAGGGLRSNDLESSLEIAKQKLENIRESGADIIVNPCSFCTFHLDTSQPALNEKYGETFRIPVLHYVQFLGLAMGLKPYELGLQKHLIPLDDLLEKVGV